MSELTIYLDQQHPYSGLNADTSHHQAFSFYFLMPAEIQNEGFDLK